MVVIDIDHINVNVDCKNIKNNRNLLYTSLKSQDTISDTLHVITVISNVCQFKRRYELMEQFIKRMEGFNNVKIYIVELAYPIDSLAVSHAYSVLLVL